MEAAPLGAEGAWEARVATKEAAERVALEGGVAGAVGQEGMERRRAVGLEAVVATAEPAGTRAEAQHTREDEGVKHEMAVECSFVDLRLTDGGGGGDGEAGGVFARSSARTASISAKLAASARRRVDVLELRRLARRSSSAFASGAYNSCGSPALSASARR